MHMSLQAIKKVDYWMIYKAFILEIESLYIPCNSGCQSGLTKVWFAICRGCLHLCWCRCGMGGLGQLGPLALHSLSSLEEIRKKLNRPKLNSLKKKKRLVTERTKTGGLSEKEGGKGGVNSEEATGSRSWRSSGPCSRSPPLCPSHWVHVWHLTGVGPAPTMHPSCVCLSSH